MFSIVAAQCCDFQCTFWSSIDIFYIFSVEWAHPCHIWLGKKDTAIFTYYNQLVKTAVLGAFKQEGRIVGKEPKWFQKHEWRKKKNTQYLILIEHTAFQPGTWQVVCIGTAWLKTSQCGSHLATSNALAGQATLEGQLHVHQSTIQCFVDIIGPQSTVEVHPFVDIHIEQSETKQANNCVSLLI